MLQDVYQDCAARENSAQPHLISRETDGNKMEIDVVGQVAIYIEEK